MATIMKKTSHRAIFMRKIRMERAKERRLNDEKPGTILKNNPDYKEIMRIISEGG